MTNTEELAKIVINALEDKKANDIKVIDIRELSVIADYFIIASGDNINQIRALADNVEEAMYKQAERQPRHIEGYDSASWILMDYNDVIIHIFSEEDRLFYDLERIWRDGKVIPVSELK
ncbi:MAG: ribosome silencing factor [Eubacterium sp.]|nr:ribosome silencing factor [Eubacterium sp.]